MIEKAHQRKIRESHQDGHPVPVDMGTASVRPITYEEAKAVILKYEWLGNMGTTTRAFGLFFSEFPNEIAGVVCFGHPKPGEVINICGEEHADKVYWLARGACVHWAHEHAGSFLITEACKQMGQPWKTRDGKDMPAKFIFLATADSDANEIGTLYQSCNWTYLGKTASPRMLNKPGEPPERAKSYESFVKGPIRNRTNRIEKPDPDGRRYFLIDGNKYYHGDTMPNGEFVGGSDKYPLRWKAEYGRTMKEAEAARLKEVLAEGYQIVKGNPKHLYVGVYGDRRMRRVLKEALTKNLPEKKRGLKYPKRGSVEVNSVGTPNDSLVQSQAPAPISTQSAGV
jgi:hypothetical protein